MCRPQSPAQDVHLVAHEGPWWVCLHMGVGRCFNRLAHHCPGPVWGEPVRPAFQGGPLPHFLCEGPCSGRSELKARPLGLSLSHNSTFNGVLQTSPSPKACYSEGTEVSISQLWCQTDASRALWREWWGGLPMCPPALCQDGRSLRVDRAQTQAPWPEALKSGPSPLPSGPTWA